MEFEGREQLVISSADFFENNKNKYIKFCKNLSQQKDKIDAQNTIQALEEVYDSLLIKNPDYEMIRKNLNLAFNSHGDFIKYVISRSFLYITSIYMKEGHNLHVYFLNAIQRALENINEEDIQVDQNEDTTPVNINFANSAFEENSFNNNKEILDEFSEIYQNNEEITFLNLYKDIPIKYKGKIIAIENEEVVYKVDVMQILAIVEEKNAFMIKSKYLKNHIKGDVVSFDIINSTIKLKNFTKMESMPASKRVYARVHPNVTTSVMLYNENGENTRGILYDISKGGLGVLSPNNLGCKNGDKLKAVFELQMPNSDKKVKINQDLELVVLINYNETYRFCMKVRGNVVEEVETFTKNREQETIEDLKKCINKYK